MVRGLLVKVDVRGPKRVHLGAVPEGRDVVGKEVVVKVQPARKSAEGHRKEWHHRPSESGQ